MTGGARVQAAAEADRDARVATRETEGRGGQADRPHDATAKWLDTQCGRTHCQHQQVRLLF